MDNLYLELEYCDSPEMVRDCIMSHNMNINDVKKDCMTNQTTEVKSKLMPLLIKACGLLQTVETVAEVKEDALTHLSKMNPKQREDHRRTQWREPYYLSTFKQELNNRKHKHYFTSSEKLDEWVIPRLLKFIRCVSVKGKMYVFIKCSSLDGVSRVKWNNFKKDHGTVSYYKAIYQSKTGKQVEQWIFESIHERPELQYFGVDFVPYPPTQEDPVRGEVFNAFQGFQAKSIDLSQASPEATEGFLAILSHLRVIWADGSEEIYNYIITWLASLIQRPTVLLTMITLIGKEGAGKTIFIDFLREYVLGLVLTHQSSNLDSITKQFNSHLQGKLLIYIAELQGTSSNDNGIVKAMDKLKPLISDPNISIEAKGQDIADYTNCGHYIASSNHTYSLRLTEENRRHVVLRVSDKVANDFEYFNKLRSHFTQDVGNMFFTYLLNYKADFSILYKIPETQILKEVKNLSLPAPIVFINSLEDGDYKLEIDVNKFGIPLDQIEQYNKQVSDAKELAKDSGKPAKLPPPLIYDAEVEIFDYEPSYDKYFKGKIEIPKPEDDWEGVQVIHIPARVKSYGIKKDLFHSCFTKWAKDSNHHGLASNHFYQKLTDACVLPHTDWRPNNGARRAVIQAEWVKPSLLNANEQTANSILGLAF